MEFGGSIFASIAAFVEVWKPFLVLFRPPQNAISISQRTTTFLTQGGRLHGAHHRICLSPLGAERVGCYRGRRRITALVYFPRPPDKTHTLWRTEKCGAAFARLRPANPKILFP
jgi:hypothetical protein